MENIGLYVLGFSGQDLLDDFVVEFAFGKVVGYGEGVQRVEDFIGAVVEVQVVECGERGGVGQVVACPQTKKSRMRLKRLLAFGLVLPCSSSSFKGF